MRLFTNLNSNFGTDAANMERCGNPCAFRVYLWLDSLYGQLVILLFLSPWIPIPTRCLPRYRSSWWHAGKKNSESNLILLLYSATTATSVAATAAAAETLSATTSLFTTEKITLNRGVQGRIQKIHFGGAWYSKIYILEYLIWFER